MLLIEADLTLIYGIRNTLAAGNSESALRTRDIPALVNPSPPRPQHGLQSLLLRHYPQRSVGVEENPNFIQAADCAAPLSQSLTELPARQSRARKRQPRQFLLFLIDEFPSLKRMEIFADALSYMAGFGLKAYLITQDIRQIVDEYGQNESIVSNCQIRVAFAPNQYDTAELLSKMTGTQTIRKASFNFSGSRMSPMLNHVSTHMDEIERPLMTPDEIMRLRPPKKESTGQQEKIIAPGDMLIFVSGHQPIYGTQMLYFADPILCSRAEIPPPTKLYSIRDGGLSPQDPLPEFTARPNPTHGPRARMRTSSSSGGGPDTPSLFDQPAAPSAGSLQAPKGLLEQLDLTT